eukprot:scaffold4084_cov194-Amphora_coffeaeformis.AAC.1
MSTSNPNADAAAINIDYATLISVISSIQITLRAAESVLHGKGRQNRKQSAFIRRKRRTMADLHYEYGSLFARAYRMSWNTFNKLFHLIKDGIAAHLRNESGL